MNEIVKMETKTFPFELKELDKADNSGIFEGYAAIFGKKDKMGETIEKGAFTKTLNEKKILPLLWYHDPRDPIGIVDDIKTDSKGLKVRGQLDLNVKSAQEKYSLMKLKAIRGLSFGYRTVKDLWDRKSGARSLLEVNLFEVSPCTFQMHPNALITGVKSLAGVIEFLEEYRSTETKNSGAIDDIVNQLTNILKGVEPSKDTPALGKGLYSPIIEALGSSKPQPHLLDSVFEALGVNQN